MAENTTSAVERLACFKGNISAEHSRYYWFGVNPPTWFAGKAAKLSLMLGVRVFCPTYIPNKWVTNSRKRAEAVETFDCFQSNVLEQGDW